MAYVERSAASSNKAATWISMSCRVATRVSDLPRPLKNWGAPWLVREILAARDRRLAGANGAPACTVSESVEAPPPVRRTPAIEWDEFVAGHRDIRGCLRVMAVFCANRSSGRGSVAGGTKRCISRRLALAPAPLRASGERVE